MSLLPKPGKDHSQIPVSSDLFILEPLEEKMTGVHIGEILRLICLQMICY